MHILQTHIKGDPNVGLGYYADDSIAVTWRTQIPLEKIKKVLKVPIFKTTIAGTSLPGVFIVGNKNGIIVPDMLFDNEIDILKSTGKKMTILKTRLTALGNNMLCNDHGCIVNPDYSDKEIQIIKEALGVEVKRGEIFGLDIVGSLAVCNQTSCMTTHDITEMEKQFIEKTLKVEVSTGTVNFGSEYVSSGIVTNSHGFLIGSQSSGPEIHNADAALGFLGDK